MKDKAFSLTELLKQLANDSDFPPKSREELITDYRRAMTLSNPPVSSTVELYKLSWLALVELFPWLATGLVHNNDYEIISYHLTPHIPPIGYDAGFMVWKIINVKADFWREVAVPRLPVMPLTSGVLWGCASSDKETWWVRLPFSLEDTQLFTHWAYTESQK